MQLTVIISFAFLSSEREACSVKTKLVETKNENIFIPSSYKSKLGNGVEGKRSQERDCFLVLSLFGNDCDVRNVAGELPF